MTPRVLLPRARHNEFALNMNRRLDENHPVSSLPPALAGIRADKRSALPSHAFMHSGSWGGLHGDPCACLPLRGQHTLAAARQSIRPALRVSRL